MSKKAIELMEYVEPIELPWHVMRFFPEGARKIDFCGDQASFGEDYGSVEELRAAIEWMADQFGGKVKWKKT